MHCDRMDDRRNISRPSLLLVFTDAGIESRCYSSILLITGFRFFFFFQMSVFSNRDLDFSSAGRYFLAFIPIKIIEYRYLLTTV